MPNKNKNKKKSNNTKATKAPRKRNRNRRKNLRLSPLVSMVSQPCSGELVHGLYGDIVGFPSRFKHTTSLQLQPCGYIAWFPDMNQSLQNRGEPSNGASAFLWQSPLSSDYPLNTGVARYGNANSNPGTTASVTRIAGDIFTTSTACAAQRTLTACLQMRYTGRMDATAGEVALVTGVTVSQLLGESNIGAFDDPLPMSVDDLFQISNHVERLNLDGHEVRFRPTRSSGTLKASPDNSVGHSSGAAIKIAPLGSIRSAATPEALALDPHAIVIAWRNFAESTPVVIESHIGLEWQPNAAQGLQAPRSQEIGPSDTFSSVLQTLDRASRTAWETVKPTVQHSVANMVAGMAQAGMQYARMRTLRLQ